MHFEFLLAQQHMPYFPTYHLWLLEFHLVKIVTLGDNTRKRWSTSRTLNGMR